jgi:hypothetical protein
MYKYLYLYCVSKKTAQTTRSSKDKPCTFISTNLTIFLSLDLDLIPILVLMILKTN